MKLQKFAGFLPLVIAPLFSGCASGPSGGTTVPAPNRLTVSLRTVAPINNGSNVYSFAFDDDDDASDGPVAIVASTDIPNGVVAGSFSVLVQYEGGQYIAYRRTLVVNGNQISERLDRASQAFVTQPSPASGNLLTFRLNLDALTDSGARLFRANVQRLDINFISANERRRDPNDNRRKAFDAFGNRSAGAFSTFDIRSSRTYLDADTVQEPSGDVQTDDTTLTNLQSLDIVDFSIVVLRS